MATTIEVNKQSVKQLLEGGKDHPFVIPEYQRPYAWEDDQVDTLFNDLWDFTTSPEGGSDGTNTYFLGCIVSYENEQGEQEIIDGQQRITSLFLLLRAIYFNLKYSGGSSKKAENFIKQNEYSASGITVTREMSSPDIRDWDLDSIVERDIRVSDEIHEILKKWDDEYKGIPAKDKPVATEEEVAMINHLKEKGLI